MNAIHKSKLVWAIMLLLPFLSLQSCSSVVKVNSRITTVKFDPINLKNYKSVQDRKDKQDPSLALGLAISGGGSRAQYFGLGVLLGLEEIKSIEDPDRNFLTDIDYYSTVSGGGFTAGYYLAMKNSVLKDNISFHDFWYSDRHLAKKGFTDRIKYNAMPIRILLNGLREANIVGGKFVRRVDKHLLHNHKIEKLTLGHFFVPDTAKRAVQLPMLLANGTVFNNTQRVPITPQNIQKMRLKSVIRPVWWHQSIDTLGFGLPIKYPIAASSGFPGVIPPVKFIAKKGRISTRIRILDGGIVDNLGYSTLFEVLKSDPNDSSRKRALVIDCSEGGNDWYSKRWISFGSLVTKHALFFTLTSKYEDYDTDMDNQAKGIIPKRNYTTIGIPSLRDTARAIYGEIKKNGYDRHIEFLDKNGVGTKSGWSHIYYWFDSLIQAKIKSKELTLEDVPKNSKRYNRSGYHIFRLKSDSFANLGKKEILFLYELASQVDTNVKIKEKEKCILLLAGRYVVYLKQKELNAIYGNPIKT